MGRAGEPPVDANVPPYAAGRDHRSKEPTAGALAARYQAFFTAEVLQEMLHRYLASAVAGKARRATCDLDEGVWRQCR